jgi:rhamnosyltransferase subunit B
VHHGGIGSCAQALRAGLPQLLWPQAYDQHDNALRLQTLGVGLRLPGPTPDAASLTRQLGRLLRSADVAIACRRHAAALQGPRLDAACAWLETMA